MKCGNPHLIASMTMLLLSTPVMAAEVETVATGRALVETNCSRCHATGTTGESTHPDAPAFRRLSRRYPVEDLEEALVEGIMTGHRDMPEFTVRPDQAAAIIAYLKTIQE